MPDDILPAVPAAILRQVHAHLSCLCAFNTGIARMRALEQRGGGAGRYEYEFRLQRESEAQQSQAWLERFATLARTNGVDPDAVFSALGGRPALETLVAGCPGVAAAITRNRRRNTHDASLQRRETVPFSRPTDPGCG